MKKIDSVGQGAVLPAGSAPVTPLVANALTLVIVQVQTHEPLASGLVERDTPYVEVLYPNGFIKWHESNDLPDLMAKIVMTLRGKYGISGFSVASAPGSLAAGEIKLEGVAYGI